MNTLMCDGLHKCFNGVPALVGVRLQFAPAGITAIMGPNGAGKTTLLNVVTGFLRADSGRCFWRDRDISRLSPDRIARLGVARTFQDLRLIRQVTVLENVLLARPSQRGETLRGALFRRGVGEEEARNRHESMRLLQFVELEENAAHLAGELSYGQQKLLTLACSLATEARVLLLDEPVAGVHPEVAVRILQRLRELRDAGKMIVFIEHDVTAVRQLADVVIVMDEGRVVAHGPTGDILERPEIMEAYLG